jgi:hypothetical protein
MMVFLHLLFAIFVSLHQVRRIRSSGLDTLAFIGFGFALVYGIAPAYFYITDADEVFRDTGVLIPYADLSSEATPFGPSVFALYVVAYLSVCTSYNASSKRPVFQTSGVEIQSRFYELFGGIYTLAGVGMLTFYIVRFGGLSAFFSSSMFLRSDPDAIFRYGIQNIAFLKNAAMIVLAGAILCGTGLSARRFKGSPILLMLFVLSFLSSLVLLVHQSGRIFLAAFVAGFLVARFIGRRKIPILKVSIALCIFSIFATIGKELFWSMAFREKTVIEAVSVPRVYHSMMSEILFPHIASITAVSAVPQTVSYRMFSDIPIAIFNLVPSSLLQSEKPRNIAEINSELIGTGSGIPVDLVGFGYYSAGIFGVLLWALFFGWLAGWLDSLFRDTQGVWAILRAFTAITFGLRVAYSEPTHILIGSLHMFIALGVVVPFIFLARSGSVKARRKRVSGAVVITRPAAAHG